MKTIRVSEMSEARGDAYLKKFADARHYDLLVNESARLVRPDGSTLCVLLKRGIERRAGLAMYKAIHNRISPTKNRGTAAGVASKRRLRNDGVLSKSSGSVNVLSSIIGYFDRYVRNPFCRKTAFDLAHPAAAAACLPALRAADALFKEHQPEAYARQLAMAKKTHPDFVLSGTVFTTITLNKNFRTACHKDAGDLPEGFGVMTYYRTGKFEGGHLVFPRFRAALALDTFDCVLFDPHQVHGNTALVPLTAGPYERITCVHYYRSGMRYCGSAAEELKIAKKHDPRKGARKINAPARLHIEGAE